MPILITVDSPVKNFTYPAVSHTAPDGTYYYTPATLVPVEVLINGTVIGSYFSETKVDLTTNYTTGDPYTVNFTETTHHVVGYTDIYVNDYSKPITDKNGNTIGYQQIYSYTRTDYSGPATWTSSIGPCYDYQLTANVNPLSNYAVESGTPISAMPFIDSFPWTQYGAPSVYANYHTKSRGTQWQLTQLTIPPDIPVPTQLSADSFDDPCTHFDPDGVFKCQNVESGNGVFGVNRSYLSPFSTNVGDLPAGTKVCFVSSVQPRAGWDKTGVDNQWDHSSLDLNNCIIVVKKPKAQVWGGDLWTQGLVDTSTTFKSSNTFGSWSEYGIIAAGGITGAASGAAYAGSGLINATACNESRLSFTNTPPGL
jgi:hypothetical protein